MRHRKLFAVALFLLLGFSVARSETDTAFVPQFRPTLDVRPALGDIRIDGQLSDPGWRSAAVADGFAEVSPGDQVRPPVESKAFVTYDDNNLYIALIAFDDPADIRTSLRDRDEIFRDDYFGIMLDTYGDGSWGYELFVNPHGIQGDLRMQSSGNEDMSFDIVWYSHGIVTDSGYQVEIAVPFASLRFPDRPEQAWRVNFWRDHQRELRRRYAWAAQDRDNSCFICQWGYMTGVRDIEPSSNLEILPNMLTTQAGSLSDRDNPRSEFDNSSPDAEFSLNARYGLTSSSSAELTFNPDFSQIESDAGQIDVNTNFALFFNERRPFFQEGSDLFNSWITAVYTRTINDPQGAAKLTGQFGRWSMAYLFARDENTPMIVPLSEQSVTLQADKATVNIARVRRSFGENSFVGLVLTDRRLDDWSDQDGYYGGGSGTTYGIDGVLRMSGNWKLEYQALGSYTDEPNAPAYIDTTMEDGNGQFSFDYGRHTLAFDGESYGGNASYVSLERNGRSWNFDVDYWEYSPTFRTDNGFTTRNDYRQVSVWFGPLFRPNRKWLIEWEPSISFGRIWDHGRDMYLNPFDFKGGSKDEWIRPNLWFNLRGQTDLWVEYLNSRERFAGKLFEGISRVTYGVDSRFSEMISGGVSSGYGRVIFRDRDNPVFGKQIDFRVYANIKPNQRLFIQPDFRFARMKHLDSYLAANPGEDKIIFSGYILRSRATYQFSRQWFLRVIVQYNDFSERLDIEPLLTWKLNPFTVFYIGASSRYQYYDSESYSAVDASEWEMSSRQFFAKFQYLFRM